MGRGRNFLEWLTDDVDLSGELMPGQPIIEITGGQRILIENHLGVRGYSMEKIVVNVNYGDLCICGSQLALLRMTKEQLIIHGRIDTVSIHRRGGQCDH